MALLAIFSISIVGCIGRSENTTINILSDKSGLFRLSVESLFPGYAIAEHTEVVFDMLQNSGMIEVYDMQIDMIRADSYHTDYNNDYNSNRGDPSTSQYWIPLTLETVVIAIDRNRTDISIETWNDLRYCDVNVSIPDTTPYVRLMIAAMSYGLEGESFSTDSAITLLRQLYMEKKLLSNDAEAPVQICFDSEAVARIKRGENIEIAIPSDGTLSFIRGILSREPIILPNDHEMILLENRLRMPDGRCWDESFPSVIEYKPAVLLDNYEYANIIMQDWTKTFRREVLRTRLYTSADGREHVIFATVFIVFAAIWGGSLVQRCRQRNIKYAILTIGILLAAWVIARIIKYQVVGENTFTRYLWYSYYPVEAAIPLIMLRIASLIGADDEIRKIPRWMPGLCSLNIVLASLVMTNDLHGMVFEIDLSMLGWADNGNYGYGVLFYVFTSIMLIELIIVIIIMYKKSKHNPRRFAFVLPSIFIAFLVLCVIGYTTGFPLILDSDMVLMYSALTLLFLEICVQIGQIPINKHYRRLFNKTGRQLQILDNEGKAVFTSDDAVPLDSSLWQRLKNSNGAERTDENSLTMINSISGGYAVWQEDISSINRLKSELEASNMRIEATNALLSRDASAKEKETQDKTKLELYEAFEKNIAPHEKRLEKMLRDFIDSRSTRAANLCAVAVLVCYIKRRCNFLVHELSGETMVPFSNFSIFIDELADIAKLTGIQCLSYSNLSGDIMLSYASILYSFFDLAMEWAITNESPGIVVHTIIEDGNIIMKLLISGDAMKYDLPQGFAIEVDDAGGRYEKKDLGNGLAGLYMSFAAACSTSKIVVA